MSTSTIGRWFKQRDGITIDKSSSAVRWGLSIGGTLSFLVLWLLITEVYPLFIELILPSPVTMVENVLASRSLIMSNFWPTFGTAMGGFALAVILGTIAAAVFTLSDVIERAFMPLAVSMNSVPRITLAPLIIFYFGNINAKLLISFWVAFFPMFLNAFEGLATIQDEEYDLLESLGATQWQEYRYIRIPNSIPHMFDGMKIAMTLAIVGAVVGEFVGAGSGLGTLALFGLRAFDTALVFGVTGIMGLVSVVLFFVLFSLQDRLVYWKETKLFGE
jgi:NitT/TauT family transport system permease protein